MSYWNLFGFFWGFRSRRDRKSRTDNHRGIARTNGDRTRKGRGDRLNRKPI
ncbi:MAG: hypothetical protein WCD53_28325 [Microcoleus sp.]